MTLTMYGGNDEQATSGRMRGRLSTMSTGDCNPQREPPTDPLLEDYLLGTTQMLLLILSEMGTAN
jgi:hypothetical protein